MGRTVALLLILFTLSSVAIAGVRQPAKTGTTIASAATYAALPACATAGATAYTEDLDLYWKCNAATGLWLPPDVQPSTIDIADYTGAALPGGSTPAWTAQGAGSASVADGELTINSVYRYYLQDADISLTNNVGMLARVKVTTQAASSDPFNTYMSLRVGSMGGWIGIVCLAIAGQAALSNSKNVYPFTVIGNELNSTTDSVDNSVYQWYYIFYSANGQTTRLGSLGDGPQYGGRVHYYTVFAGAADNTTANFGSYAGTGANVSVWDRVMVFTY